MKSQISNLKSQNYKTGQVILLTVLILGGSILGASTIAGYLMLLKIRGASDITNSNKAVFAADAGVEWDLYQRFKAGNNTPGTFTNPVMLSNGATVEVVRGANSTKSIGQATGIFRAFELDFNTPTITLP